MELCFIRNPLRVYTWSIIVIYINDLHLVVGSVCKLFADDCKLYCNIESEADMMELQEDTERLCKWSTYWLLGFNIKKCKVISFGNIHFEIEYSLTDSENNSHTLSLEDYECDLGILFKKNLKFDEHIGNVVNKVNRVSGLIRRKFTHIDKSTFLTFYKSFVFYRFIHILQLIKLVLPSHQIQSSIS